VPADEAATAEDEDPTHDVTRGEYRVKPLV